MMTLSKVLAVILNYKGADLTIALIRSLKQIPYEGLDILVVDNCSPDNSVEILRPQQDKLGFVLIANSKNAGYAAGNNVGIRYAIEHGYDYSWILNNDIELIDINILGILITEAKNDTKIGGVGPIVIDHDRIIQPYRERPSFWDMTLGFYSFAKRRAKIPHDYNGPVYRIYGCCMLLDNAIMQKVDLMDERTFLYYEEDILGEKLFGKGYYFYYTSSTKVNHFGSLIVKKEIGKKNRRKLKINQASQHIYLKYYRHYGIFKEMTIRLFSCIIYYLR